MVAAAVDELAGFLRADGADLLAARRRPEDGARAPRLVLDSVSCADCILPPDDLRDTISDALSAPDRRVSSSSCSTIRAAW